VSTSERIAVIALGCLLVRAVVFGAQAAVRPTPKVPNPHGLALDAGVDMRRGVDPLNPPGMPAGARIDPETGLLSGVALEAGPGERVLDWVALAAADDAGSRADLPEHLRALDGARVAIAGFLMPLYAMSDIREFALVGSHYTCCFGTPPGLGGQFLVTLRDGEDGLDPTVKPLQVRGTLRIREMYLHEGRDAPLVSLFEIVGARAALLGYE
jgi:hypothetical protein